MKILPTSLISNNGSLRAFDIDGLLHPAKPIEQLIKISFHNLIKDELYRVQFTNKINYDLKLIHYYFDDTTATIQIDKLDKETTVDSFNLEFPQTTIIYILESNQNYQIKSNQDLNRLTLFCEPIYLLESIDFVFPTVDFVAINPNATIPNPDFVSYA